MSVQKQSVSFTEPAFAYAKELVESGEYPNVSAAVSGELAKAKRLREREARLLEAEITRRIALPADEWHPADELGDVTEAALSQLESLVQAQSKRVSRARQQRSSG